MRYGVAFGLLLVVAQAHAVVVRGKVTTGLGVPLAGARVQLIRLDEGARSVADTVSGVDGAFEIQSGASGRFLLLTAPSIMSPGYAPQIGEPFYGGRADILRMDVVLNGSSITPETSSVQMLKVTPLPQLADRPVQVAADVLLTQATIEPELRPNPGVSVVQYGQLGLPSALYLRGAPVGRMEIDGVTAESLGGGFNLATVTTSGLEAVDSRPAIELAPGGNALHLMDAGAGMLSLRTATALTLHPNLTYVGDWGNLSTERNEAIFSLAHTRSDVVGSFSRLNSDNDLPAARLHLISSAADLGYHVSGETSLRLTLRDDVGATPLALPFSFYLLQPAGKQTSQNLYSALTFDTTSTSGWHNLLRYGLVRERAEVSDFSTASTGLPVTITGTNGYTVSGVATFPTMAAREDFVTNRDEATYQTQIQVKGYLKVLGEVNYEDERGADLTVASSSTRPGALERRHISVAGSVTGEIRNRFFYDVAGFFDDGTLGLRGAPSVGLTYVPVRPGSRRFRGTNLHLTASAGVRELSTQEQLQLGPNAAPPRSRTFDASVDQEIFPRRLALRAAYFHGQFAHETETLGLAPLTLGNALAYRTQGLETTLTYRPATRLFVSGGYTYLASLVEQSGAVAMFNPVLPGVRIGALTALVGARPFDRPPSTGFVRAGYSGKAITAGIKSSFASASDESTKLYLNKNLLLPNRNLSPGYASVDADFSVRVTGHVAVFSEFRNLLDERTIAPVGFLSAPFGVRVGVRIRVGRE